MHERLLGAEGLSEAGRAAQPCATLRQEIFAKITADAPLLTNQGGVQGHRHRADELGALGLARLPATAANARAAQHRHPSLKVAYNKVFGYCPEVTNAHATKCRGSASRRW
jgi:DNA mismatch repair protein MutS